MIFKPHTGTLGLTDEMKKRVNAFVVLCKEKELNIKITETWRTKARQLYLWAKGRYVSPSLEMEYLGYDDPNIYSKPKEPRVTWTLKSNHIIGEAIDICFVVGSGISYSGNWDAVYDVAESVGLQSLFRIYGIDKPHLELNHDWSPADEDQKQIIASLEANFKTHSDLVHNELKRWNECKKLLAEAKKVVYKPYRII